MLVLDTGILHCLTNDVVHHLNGAPLPEDNLLHRCAVWHSCIPNRNDCVPLCIENDAAWNQVLVQQCTVSITRGADSACRGLTCQKPQELQQDTSGRHLWTEGCIQAKNFCICVTPTGSPSDANAVPSEYMGSTTTQPKGSPALILEATFKASSTGIRWFALPLKHRELVISTQLECLNKIRMLAHDTGL